MSSVLVAYATRYGSTHEAAEAVAAALADRGVATRTALLGEVTDLTGCTGVVVGAPLFMGAWHMDAHAFLRAHREALARLPVAVFALGPTRDPYDPAEWEHSRAQLAKALGRHPWLHPVDVAIFGGRYDPTVARLTRPRPDATGHPHSSDEAAHAELGVDSRHVADADPRDHVAPLAGDIRDGLKVAQWGAALAERMTATGDFSKT